MKIPKANKLLRGAAAGLVAGIVASYAMEKFQAAITSLSESEEEKKPQKKQSETATETVARELSETVLDRHPTKQEKEIGGETVHYTMGGVSGMLYGVAAEISPRSTTGLGLPFGTSVWLGADEIGTWAAGLAKAPTNYSLSKHMYALSSHLVYGLTTELVRRGVRKIL